MNFQFLLSLFLISSTAMFLVGCGGPPAVRTYHEITQQADRTPQKEGRGEGLTWTKPEGWRELPKQAGKRGGMSIPRIATFEVESEETEEDSAQVTMVAFPTSGGLRANLVRWLGQLYVEPADEAIDRFLENDLKKVQTKGGRLATIADLGSFVKEPPETPSMLVGTIDLENDRTLYVKMTGSRQILASELEAFTALCASIE